jgi:hypothetical protein
VGRHPIRRIAATLALFIGLATPVRANLTYKFVN